MRARRSRDRGSLNLELAFALPVLLMLTVGSIFLGLAYINKAGLQSSASIGARTAAYYGGDYSEVRQDIIDEAMARSTGDRGNIQATIQFVDGAGTPYYTSSFRLADGPAAPAVAAPSGSRIRILVEYADYPLSIPFVISENIDLKGEALARNTVP